MRALLLAFALFLSLTLPAHADRVMEVQNIRVEGAAGRDAAVADATKQAAQQVWSRMGRTTPLPDLSPTQLQGIASYVDIANEVVQPNYYAGNFNVGIQVGALMRVAQGGSATIAPTPSVQTGDAYRPASSPATPQTTALDKPDWILVITGREAGGAITLWQAEDDWTKAWQRALSNDLPTAVATGDANDQKVLTPTLVQNYDASLPDKLNTLASKYHAPAIALVVLSSQRSDIALNEEVKIEVSYLEKGMAEPLTSQGTLFITSTLPGGPYGAAVAEGQKLLAALATGSPAAPATSAPDYAYQPTGQPGLSGQHGTTYTGVQQTSSANKLWVRIPLATPADLANYRRKIEAIPGARFEMTTLNRMYVEGNIIYTGDQNTLMQQLAAAGLRQQ